MSWARVLAVGVALGSGGLALGGAGDPTVASASPLPHSLARAGKCPAEMARVAGFCIDRWEVHAVDLKSGLRLSPYYPPEPRLLKFAHSFWAAEAAWVGSAEARRLRVPPVPEHQKGEFSPKAVSAPGVLPQGYMTYYSAKRACQNAGKRLCTEDEWVRACRGSRGAKHPYGSNYQARRCNVFRDMHPAYELHGNSSIGHLDPRLHLVVQEGHKPLLAETGSFESCASSGSDGQEIFDMVGNLDEWIDDPKGTFVGGFFSRSTREGCEAKIEGHAAQYADYSLGTRCCK